MAFGENKPNNTIIKDIIEKEIKLADQELDREEKMFGFIYTPLLLGRIKIPPQKRIKDYSNKINDLK